MNTSFSYDQPVLHRAGARLVLLTLISVLLAGVGLVASSSPASAAGAPCKTVKTVSAGKLRKAQTVCYSTPWVTSTGFSVGYRDSAKNSTSKPMQASCQSDVSKTVTKSMEAGVSVEGSAWIFARASASAKGGLSKSLSSGYKVSVSFEVPARVTRYCTRGIITKSFASQRVITTRTYTYAGAKQSQRVRKSTSTKIVRGFAPNMAQWRLS